MSLSQKFTAIMNWKTQGLFLVYLLEVPAEHPFVARRFFWLSNAEMLGAFGWLSYIIMGCVLWFCLQKSVWYHQLGVAVICALGFYLLWTDAGGECRDWLIKTMGRFDLFPELQSELVKNPSEKGESFALGIVLWGLAAVFVLSIWPLPFDSNIRFWMLNGVLALVLCSIMRGHHGGYT